MSSPHHRRVADLFSRALDLSAGQREAFLLAECDDDAGLHAEVRAMLHADENAPKFLDQGAGAVFASEDAFALPRTFAGYELREVLGRGGMATVFLAIQQNPNREVAVKLMQPEIGAGDARQRFALEAELLGRLEHPGIAQVFEAGIGEWQGTPRPYFALERVDGVDLIAHARARDLDTRGRVALLAAVCDAVHHAHQKGVLHRDLKPSNILVNADGRPKVLDFGVGRLLQPGQAAGSTVTGMVLGTLAYMSPEQASGELHRVDVRADVYSLGVVLYELLCGELPIAVEGLPITSAVGRIQDATPVRLGTVDARLRGDLETIAAKALSKEPERRYASAAAFAEDLRRFLAHEPIAARPTTVRYRASKFISRNRGLSAGIAIALVAIVGATVLSIGWALQAESAAAAATEARGRTAVEAAANAEVIEYVEQLFAAAMPSVPRGDELTVRQFVDTARAGVRARDPAAGEIDSWVEARVEAFLGSVLLSLGDYDAADAAIEVALPALRARDGAEHPRVLAALADQAQMASRQDPAEAQRLYVALLPRARAIGDAGLAIVARCETGLAYLARAQDDLVAAEVHFRAALAAHDRRGQGEPTTDIRRAQARVELATIMTDTQRYDEAMALLGAAGEIAAGGGSVLYRAKVEEALGVVHFRRRDLAAAEAAMRMSLDLTADVVPDDHPLLVRRLLNLGGALAAGGRLEAAEPLLQRAVAIADGSSAVAPEAHAQALQNLGNLRLASADPTAAMKCYADALAIWTELAGADSLGAASVYMSMAGAHDANGNPDQAAELRLRAERIRSGSGR